MRRAGVGWRCVIAGSMMTAALTTGCLVERPYDRDLEGDGVLSRPNDRNGNYRPVRGAVDGRLQGAIGPLSGLDHQANLLSAYDDGYYMSVETVVELENRAVMTLLSVSNGGELFQPGLNATFSLDNYDNGGVQVTVLGCVGQGVGVYDEYDMPADETTVLVRDGRDMNEMDVTMTARWFDRDQQTGTRLTTSRTAQTQFTLLR
jgi:hypothetical protein